MHEKLIKSKLNFYSAMEEVPVILHYGDTLWRKGLFGFTLVDLPGGKEYGQESLASEPIIKAKRKQVVTQDSAGVASHGIGTIAANLTEVGGLDRYDSLKLILNADPNASGIAYVTRKGQILDWIDREDVPDL